MKRKYRGFAGQILLMAFSTSSAWAQPIAASPFVMPAAHETAASLGPFQKQLKELNAFLLKFAADYSLRMVLIAPGDFLMGNKDDGPAHHVRISRPYFLGATEVNQAQWRAVMGTTPSNFNGDTLPVEQVSWEDAMAFCKKLNDRERVAGRLPTGWEFTLPTEAQWEYACRAGTTGDYAGNLDAMAWYNRNSAGTTHPVGTKQPNAWGLYDMHGNVFNWCADWAELYYPDENATDPSGPLAGSSRIYRGGAWFYPAEGCRSASRKWYIPSLRYNCLGFRLAFVATR